MTEIPRDILEKYQTVIDNAQELTFLPRDIELQKGAIVEISELLEEISSVKKEAAENGNEERANQLLTLYFMSKSVKHELKMWVELKNETWDEAWDALVTAQESAEEAQGIHEIALKLNVKNHRRKLLTIEKFVFPPQVFLSPGMVVSEFECSICGDDYEECKHIENQAYSGEVCKRIVRDIAGFREVSIVDDPADKRARVMYFTTGDGKIRNRMTWSVSDPDEHPSEMDVSEEGRNMSGIVMTADDVEGSEF